MPYYCYIIRQGEFEGYDHEFIQKHKICTTMIYVHWRLIIEYKIKCETTQSIVM